MKKVSVIIPCYNVEKFIERCIDCLIAQTIGLENIELIFVDDASTDNTLNKLKEYERKFPNNILVVHCDENGRQGRARNIGMNYATGEYIGFVDADDYVEYDMYQQLYETAKQEKCECVSGLYVREWEDGTPVKAVEHRDDIGKKYTIISQEDRKKYLRNRIPGGVWNSLYNRFFLEKNGLYFPEYITYEDNYWMGILSFCISNYYIVDKVFYHYTVNTNSTLVQRNSIHHFDRLKIEMMKLDWYREQGCFDLYYDEIEISFVEQFFLNTLSIIFTRFSLMPYDVIWYMKRKLREIFPQYYLNPYIQDLNPLFGQIIELSKYDWDKKTIDEICEEFNQLCN